MSDFIKSSIMSTRYKAGSNFPYNGLKVSMNFPIDHQLVDDPRFNSEETDRVESWASAETRHRKNFLAIFTIMHCARRTLPYGIWTCADGREVVFNREYQPIAQRKDGVVSYPNRDEYVVDIVSAAMIYNDGCSPMDYLVKHLGYANLDPNQTRDCKKALIRCLRVLRDFTPEEYISVSRQWSISKQLI